MTRPDLPGCLLGLLAGHADREALWLAASLGGA
jgi:hypothetical protein